MSARVAVDWTACRGRGACSELLPERISLDQWGYPLLDPAAIPADLVGHARQTVNACPTRALRLQEPVESNRHAPAKARRPREPTSPGPA